MTRRELLLTEVTSIPRVVHAAGLAPSVSVARRLVAQGRVRLDDDHADLRDPDVQPGVCASISVDHRVVRLLGPDDADPLHIVEEARQERDDILDSMNAADREREADLVLSIFGFPEPAALSLIVLPFTAIDDPYGRRHAVIHIKCDADPDLDGTYFKIDALTFFWFCARASKAARDGDLHIDVFPGWWSVRLSRRGRFFAH